VTENATALVERWAKVEAYALAREMLGECEMDDRCPPEAMRLLIADVATKRRIARVALGMAPDGGSETGGLPEE